MTTTAPYGAWRSPITAASIVERSVGLSQVAVDGDTVYWNESRPNEAGRQVIVRWRDGERVDVLPGEFSARTLAHEYGGRCYAVHAGVVWFSNFADQRIWRVDPGAEPRPITAEPPTPMSVRFADPVVTPDGSWVVCVRERHLGPAATDVVNDVVAVPATGGGDPVVLCEGGDFYAAPRVSPDGRRLAWLAWDHPNMPWDGTVLRVADLHDDPSTGEPRVVAGGPTQWVSQPRWTPDGLVFTSDHDGGWSRLYVDDGGTGVGLCDLDAEFSGPDWVFGQATYDVVGGGTLVAAWSSQGLDHLGVVAGGEARPIDVPFTSIDDVHAVGSEPAIVCIAGSALEPAAVVRISVPDGTVAVLARSRETTVDPGYLSTPRPIEFPTENLTTAHALFYPPANRDFVAPAGEKPPLIVISHGGPTSATSSRFNIGIQYWTSRGFAVVDVNYGGSTGYGREYRERLAGQWGIVDVDDCVNAARHLAQQGEVDGDRMVIRGGSAGGYTTLAALTFRDTFAAGASHYGVADAEALALHTHKFESRYLDKLIGPYPDAVDVYKQRSPIEHTDRLSRPMILFQGLDDKVVPPEQAEMMVEALRGKGIPFVYLAFEGEQHGFRKAETIVRVYDAELSFYGRVLGFAPAGETEPVRLENEEALPR
ncbi:MAG TPA: S9 family peptidase [Acidimicrobiales bacterium]|nr:S9 family peptidase [Acidimicrobiales bacterium]